jgi:hypothetical protein
MPWFAKWRGAGDVDGIRDELLTNACDGSAAFDKEIIDGLGALSAELNDRAVVALSEVRICRSAPTARPQLVGCDGH